MKDNPRARADLRLLLAILLALRQKGRGDRLPIYSDVFVVFLASHPNGAATMKEFREYFSLGQSRTSRTCFALEREGLVHISTPPDDARRSLVTLSTKGARRIDDALAVLRGRRR